MSEAELRLKWLEELLEADYAWDTFMYNCCKSVLEDPIPEWVRKQSDM